jgi:hypothetical protein
MRHCQNGRRLAKWKLSFHGEFCFSICFVDADTSHSTFTNMYAEDKKNYGKPDTSFKITDIGDLNHWQRVLNSHAGKVQGGEQKRSKRKCTE